jgi:hypothetical protein
MWIGLGVVASYAISLPVMVYALRYAPEGEETADGGFRIITKDKK